MVPACYPSKISSTTGLREAVVFALPSVTGLVRWTDYIPVKLVASADAALEGRTDAGGFIPMDMLSSNTGLMGWVDYLPVYVDNSATDAWAITATGVHSLRCVRGLYLPGQQSPTSPAPRRPRAQALSAPSHWQARSLAYQPPTLSVSVAQHR